MIKRTIKNIFLLGFIFLLIFYFNDIKKFVINIVDNIVSEKEETFNKPPKINDYKLNYDYNYVKNTEDFTPNNSDDIKNIIYTILNNGWDKYSFICPKEYKTCSEDVLAITNNNVILSDINSFVHPFNSFKKISTTYTTNHKFTIEIEKNYDETMITQISAKVIGFYTVAQEKNMSTKEMIKFFHDYIIDNTVYDENYTKGIKYFSSNTAYGALIQGSAICSGYTDAMAIFLNLMDIPNYKISSERHIWNLVYLDGSWKHLDLTFDDPVTENKEQILEHNYFLINTSKLHSLDTAEHIFDTNVFSEAN